MADKERKILLGLTTTPGSDWKEKIREIDELGLKEIALFPTFINLGERKELYTLLEKTGLGSIPHIHLRNDDTEEWEMDFLTEKYGAMVFNIHPEENPFKLLKGKYGKKIYIENLYGVYRGNALFSEETFKKYNVAGLCLDFSHIEVERRTDPADYRATCELLEKYPIGCNHISVIVDEMYVDPIDGISKYDKHFLTDLSQLDYLKNYPSKYFSPFVSIELENSFGRQLEAKKYIENIINNIELSRA